MNREAAVERLAKLEALADPARGGTEGERAVARSKADALRAKFGIERHETRAKPQRRRVFTASERGEAWSFDIYTGKGSKNVRVERYDGPGSWKIEIPL